MNPEVRIAVVEDRAEFRRAIVCALNARAGWRVVAECADAAQALRNIPGAQVNIVLLDLLLPGTSGTAAIPQLKKALPKVPIIMLTVVDSPEEIVSALEAGASGYILKGGSTSELVANVEDVLAGGAIMSPAVARRVVEYFQRRQASSAPAEFGLTAREWEVLRLAARGRQHGEISMSLGIAVNTVKNHFRNIYEKLGVSSFTDAMVKLRGGRDLLDGV
ncbi:MAG: response regulator transcription factor [Verrucomicrobiae bacterium]|nr:response regulator transcription factor [Verrucomicrobiae bacterium]